MFSFLIVLLTLFTVLLFASCKSKKQVKGKPKPKPKPLFSIFGLVVCLLFAFVVLTVQSAMAAIDSTQLVNGVATIGTIAAAVDAAANHSADTSLIAEIFTILGGLIAFFWHLSHSKSITKTLTNQNTAAIPVSPVTINTGSPAVEATPSTNIPPLV